MFSKGLSDQLGQTKRFFPSVIGVLALLGIALVAVFNLFDHNGEKEGLRDGGTAAAHSLSVCGACGVCGA